VEDSVYVHPQWQRRGIGAALLTQVLARGDLLGFRETIAVISTDQAGSLALHQRHGFRQAGVLRRVGYKFERWLDVVYLQRSAGG
jgi:phosphinothricin acetyltransferase